MTRLIASLILATSVLAGISTAKAEPSYGHALRDLAQSGSNITPHGVFDGQ